MGEQVWVGGVTGVARVCNRLNVTRLGVRLKPSSFPVTSLITHSPSTAQDTAQYRQFFRLSLPKSSPGDNSSYSSSPYIIPSLLSLVMICSTSSRPSLVHSDLSYPVQYYPSHYIHIETRCDLFCCIISLPSLLPSTALL